MRRGTFITLVVLFVVLIAAALYQLTLGGESREPLCGPTTPGGLPSSGACPSSPAA